MQKTLAQGLQIQPEGAAPVNIKSPLVGINNLGDLINVLMSFIVPLAGIILFFILIWGGYDILMSQGESDKVESGKNKITAGIIGIVLLVLSYLITNVIGYIFGLDRSFFQ
ncbi:MAG TPA: hypothetical protein PLS49_08375 [Candidatus Woesebacteria bacterium]|nr:hypothetical protein [Candidatus Woesebacteria bacterium]